MEELLKKVVYTGVGLVSLTAEKLQEQMDKLIEEEKISQEEGKKVVDEFVKEAEEKKSEFDEKVKAATDEFFESFRFTSAKKVDELTKRVEALEAKLGMVKEIEVTEEKKTKTTKKKATPKA